MGIWSKRGHQVSFTGLLQTNAQENMPSFPQVACSMEWDTKEIEGRHNIDSMDQFISKASVLSSLSQTHESIPFTSDVLIHED